MMGDDPVYLKTVPCGKHYFANNTEFNRHNSSSDMDDRDMREFYLAPYKALIEKDKLPGIMTCYNAVNGVPMSASKYLVDTIARKTYGLNGYITGDCGAIQDIFAGHFYATTGAEATAYGLKSGVDTDCGSIYQTSAIDAINAGLITEADIDLALVNMFTIRMRTGEFDPSASVPFTSIKPDVVNSPEHVALAVEIAKKTPVLLKNNIVEKTGKRPLPIDAGTVKRIAVIGPQADKVELGPYSGKTLDVNMVSPLSGIKNLLSAKGSSAEIVYNAGGNTVNMSNLFNIYAFEIVRKNRSVTKYDAAQFTASSKGITAIAGMTYIKSVKNIVDGDWTSYKNVNVSNIDSINLILTVPGDGGTIEFRSGSPSGTLLASYDAKGGEGMASAFTPKTVSFKANQTGASGNRTLYLVYRAHEKTPISKETIEIAASADVAIVFVGTDNQTANEEADRLTLFLPGNQYELIKAVAGVNPNTIVVMQSHGMVEVEQFKNIPNIAGIIWTGFNGQAQGTAMASILFGDANPGGKAPGNMVQVT